MALSSTRRGENLARNAKLLRGVPPREAKLDSSAITIIHNTYTLNPYIACSLSPARCLGLFFFLVPRPRSLSPSAVAGFILFKHVCTEVSHRQQIYRRCRHRGAYIVLTARPLHYTVIIIIIHIIYIYMCYIPVVYYTLCTRYVRCIRIYTG